MFLRLKLKCLTFYGKSWLKNRKEKQISAKLSVKLYLQLNVSFFVAQINLIFPYQKTTRKHKI